MSPSRWLIVCLGAVALVLVAADRQVAARTSSAGLLVPTLRYHPARAHLASVDSLARDRLADQQVPSRHTLRPGETLASVLDRLGFQSAERLEVVDAAGDLIDLRKLRAGDPYTVFYRDEAVAAIHLPVRDKGRLALERDGTGWSAAFDAYLRRVELATVRGTLSGLLEHAIESAGGEAALAYAMSDVLQWDLDFNRDLRVGDRFEVLYERVYLDRRPAGLGRILALTYDSGERRLSAYLYGEGDDYYDADGRPLEKMFLRSPMQYSRVTSGFSSRRFHPVLKTYRPHYGVDYGAPEGTPVRVTANGVVASAAWDKGGGRMVKVRHANGYLTAYLHLSAYAEGVRSGTRVRQGQVIGYVGSTGLATAPHLDYRVQLAGRWINPLSLQNEPAPPIPEERRADFHAWRTLLDTSLREGTPRPEVLLATSGGGSGTGTVVR